MPHYRKNTGFVPRNSKNLIQINVLLPKESFVEIDRLAQSRDQKISSLIRELIEIGLLELEEQGEIYLGRKK